MDSMERPRNAARKTRRADSELQTAGCKTPHVFKGGKVKLFKGFMGVLSVGCMLGIAGMVGVVGIGTTGVFAQVNAQPRAQLSMQAATQVIIVRHAEKVSGDGDDPGLTVLGQRRAAALADILSDAGVGAIFSTQFKRNIQTVTPIAEKVGLRVNVRPISSASLGDHARALAAEVRDMHGGETVLIVGHSNTVDDLVAEFGGPTLDDLAHDDYDNIYLLMVVPNKATGFIQLAYPVLADEQAMPSASIKSQPNAMFP